MGIGNPRTALYIRDGLILITPHGDRKPGNSPASGSAYATHYPSWGSETLRVMPGDSYSRISHYPSWGSETGHSRNALSSFSDSLPLMGIGNPSGYLSFPSHMPVVLAKMRNYEPKKCAGPTDHEWIYAQAHIRLIRQQTSSCHATRPRPGASVLRERPWRTD